MKLNRKGYLTVEIILASTIAFAIAFFLIEITVKLVSKTDDIYRDTIITTDSSIVTRNIKKEIKKVINEEENNKTISNITCINDKECKITFKDTNNNSITNIVKTEKNKIEYIDANNNSKYSKELDNSISELKIYSNIKEDFSEESSVYLKIVGKNIFTGKEYLIIIPIYNSNATKYVAKKYTVEVYRKLGNNTKLYKTLSDQEEYSTVKFDVNGTSAYSVYEGISCNNGSASRVSNEGDTHNFAVEGITSDMKCTVSFSASKKAINIISKLGTTTETVASNVEIAYGGSSNYYTIKGNTSNPSYKSTTCTNGQNYDAKIYSAHANGYEELDFRVKNVTENTTCTVVFGPRASETYKISLYKDGDYLGEFIVDKGRTFRTKFNAPVESTARCTNNQKPSISSIGGINYEISIKEVTSNTRCDIDY